MKGKLPVGGSTQPIEDLRGIEEFKRFLGSLAEEYSEAQIRQLQWEMFEIADLLLEIHRAKQTKQFARKASAFDESRETR